jgi:hypothetical protein
MPRIIPTAAVALAVGFLPAPPALAQVVVQYNFDNTTAASTAAPPSSTAANVTGSATGNGANLVQDFSIADYGQQVLRAAVSATATPDDASAVAGDTYWNFTVAPAGGFRMNLSTFTFDVARGGASTPASAGSRRATGSPGRMHSPRGRP